MKNRGPEKQKYKNTQASNVSSTDVKVLHIE